MAIRLTWLPAHWGKIICLCKHIMRVKPSTVRRIALVLVDYDHQPFPNMHSRLTPPASTAPPWFPPSWHRPHTPTHKPWPLASRWRAGIEHSTTHTISNRVGAFAPAGHGTSTKCLFSGLHREQVHNPNGQKACSGEVGEGHFQFIYSSMIRVQHSHLITSLTLQGNSEVAGQESACS